jgi:hypothetical protein
VKPRGGVSWIFAKERFPYMSYGQVSVLLHPATVPIIGIFRSFNSLDDQYDLTLLDAPERILAKRASPEAAKAIVSDALLFAFALARQRNEPLSYKPVGSRHASMDEYCLLALIGSSRVPDSELTFEAATALGVASLSFMTTLAGDLVRQIDLAGLHFETPGIDEFRGIVGDRLLLEDHLDEPFGRPEMKFRF